MVTKNENDVINYSPSFHSKPIRPFCIFRTQFNILQDSDGIQELTDPQRNYHVQGPER